MSRVRATLRGMGRALVAPPLAVVRWIAAWDPIERVMYSGLALIALGLLFVYPPAAAIASGSILVYVAVRRAPRPEAD